jgi:DNA replication protein DnaC
MKMQNLMQLLRELKLLGMANALDFQGKNTEAMSLSFEERLTLLIDHELTHRSDRKLKSRQRIAKLREPAAAIEELIFRQDRGLDKNQIMSLANCDWLSKKLNTIIIGSTGTGKTYLSSALSNRACREGYSCRYYRVPRLLHDLAISRADGSYSKFMITLTKTDLLVLDDWGISPLNEDNRRDLLELVDDRYKARSLIITSQLPIESWFDQIGEPTIADAIMDRLISSSYKIKLLGKSMRPEETPLTKKISKVKNQERPETSE